MQPRIDATFFVSTRDKCMNVNTNVQAKLLVFQTLKERREGPSKCNTMERAKWLGWEGPSKCNTIGVQVSVMRRAK